MSSMYMSPVQALNTKITSFAATLEQLQESVKQVRNSCGLDRESGGQEEEDHLLRVRILIDEACTLVRANFKEDLRKERHLLDVAMTHKCEHAITQMIRDKFELLSKRCDILAEATSCNKTVASSTETLTTHKSTTEEDDAQQQQQASVNGSVTTARALEVLQGDVESMKKQVLQNCTTSESVSQPDFEGLKAAFEEFVATNEELRKKEERDRQDIVTKLQAEVQHANERRDKDRVRFNQEITAQNRVIDDKLKMISASLHALDCKCESTCSAFRDDLAAYKTELSSSKGSVGPVAPQHPSPVHEEEAAAEDDENPPPAAAASPITTNISTANTANCDEDHPISPEAPESIQGKKEASTKSSGTKGPKSIRARKNNTLRL